MSDDESGVGDHHDGGGGGNCASNNNGAAANDQSFDVDHNDSLITKVKSRVSSILPNSFSKWFSPVATDKLITTNDTLSRNGTPARRRRASESDASDNDDDQLDDTQPTNRRLSLNPPQSKRSKMALMDIDATTTIVTSSPSSGNNRPYMRKTTNTTTTTSGGRYQSPITASTSTPGLERFRRHHLAFDKNAAPYNFGSYSGGADELGAATKLESYEDQIMQRRRLNIPQVNSGNSVGVSYRRRMLHHHSDASRNNNKYVNRTRIDEDDEDETRELDDTASVGDLDEEDEDMLAATNGNDSASEINSSLSRGSSVHAATPTPHSNDGRRLSGLFHTNNSNSNNLGGDRFSFSAHLQSDKSLFSDKNMSRLLNNSTTSLNSLNHSRPSRYGSTSALSDSRLLNTNSPFYHGRTMYGGASAYGRRESSLSGQRTLRVPTQIRPSSSLSTLSSTKSVDALANPLSSSGISGMEHGRMSSTTKRIMELMNTISTPLNDIKKMGSSKLAPALIAHRPRFGEDELNRSREMRTKGSPYSRPMNNSKMSSSFMSHGAPTTELQIPSVSQLMQMKKLHNNTERMRRIASSSGSELNKPQEYKLPDNATSSVVDGDKQKAFTGKVRPKLNQVRERPNIENETNGIVMPILPTIPLPLKSNAVISFNAGNIQKPPVSASDALAQKAALNQLSAKATPSFGLGGSSTSKVTPSGKSSGAVGFTFSSPIAVATGSTNDIKQGTISGVNNFKFREPLNMDASHKMDCTDSPPSKSPSIVFGKATSDGSPQLKLGSVLDALSKPIGNDCSTGTSGVSTSKSTPIGFGDRFKTTQGNWECDSCMLSNKSDDVKCIACETPKKGAAPKKLATCEKGMLSSASSMSSSSGFSGFGNLIKTNYSNTWECDSCMVRNKTEDAKCVSCCSAKPGAAAAPAKPWECDSCMVKNEANKMKCVCCDQPKPGSAGAVDSIATKPTLKPATAANDLLLKSSSGIKFSFGVPPAAAAAASTSAAVSSTITSVPAASFTIGTPAPASSSFSFGEPAALSVSTNDNKSASTMSKFKFSSPAGLEQKTEETAKPNFVFGSANPSAAASVSESPAKPIFSFGAPKIAESSVPTEKLSSVATSGTFGQLGSTAFSSSPASSSSSNKSATSSITFGSTPVSSAGVGGFMFGSAKPVESKIGSTSSAGSIIGSSLTPSTNEKAQPPGLMFGSHNLTATTSTAPSMPFSSTAAVVSSSSANQAISVISTSSVIPQQSLTGFSMGAGLATKSNAPSFGGFGATTSTTTKSDGVSQQSLFGSIATSNTDNSTIKPFGFGAIKTDVSTPFGTTQSNATVTTFGSGQTSTFGSTNANMGPAFGGNAAASTFGNTAAAASATTFGSVSNAAPTTFGSAASTQQSPVFGSNPATTAQQSIFGSAVSTTTNPQQPPSFGSAVTSNNTPSFGAASTGGIQPTLFGSATSSGGATAGPFGSSTPTFGVAASNTSNGQTSSLFGSSPAGNQNSGLTFGGAAAGSTAPAFGSSTSAIGSAQTSSIFGSNNTTGGNTGAAPPSFGSTPATTTQSSSLFMFGGNQATATAAPSFGSNAPHQNASGRPSPAFGQSQTPSATFGTFGSAAAQSIQPVFGSTAPTSAFGANNNGAASSSAFASPATIASYGSNPPAFGAQANAGVAPNATPFGNASSGASAFGSSAINNNAFGTAAPPTFGASPSPSPSPFGTVASSDEPSEKKMFAFGGNNNTSQPAAFNFGGNNTAPPAAPKAFSFSSTTPDFNFNSTQAPANAPFQFGSAAVAPTNNNMFAPTTNQQSQRRKIRAQRRVVPR